MHKKFLITALLTCFMFGMASAQPSNGKTMKAYMVADAHLDTQWNWDIQTTIKQYVWNTLSQNLYLLKTYPDYIFNFEGAVKYNWMKEYYPREFEEMKKYVANGRWHLTGSSWDADETIVCSPESWLRNILLGQTFYRNEFNKESTDVFLPDCFGFGYDLPTLAAHCGLIGFSSQKIGWRTNPFFEGGKKYPFTIGLWQGIDGSKIMFAHGFGYGERFHDEDISDNKMLKEDIAQSPLNMVYRYYGTGDRGGSPTISSVRAIEKGIHGNGPIQIISAASDQMYKDFQPYDKHPELPTYNGELLMDVHGTGCYTSEAAMKLYNRQNEHLGDAAERSAVAAEWLGTKVYPQKEITDNWRRVILHQFHDDITGTSIPRAYEFSWNDELISLERYANIITTSVSGVASKMDTKVSGIPVILYNNESFPMNAVAEITLPQMATSYTVQNAKGKIVASQVVTDRNGNRHLLVDASLPGTSYSVFNVKAGGKALAAVDKGTNVIENSVYKVTVDGNGDISSLIDKRNGKELVENGKTIGLVVFDDCTSASWPSWEVIKATIDKTPVKIDKDVTVKLVEDGALRKALRITKTYDDSKITQYIRLYEGSQADRIDFYNEVDWHSMNSLLKAQFPLSISNPNATYDLGLGSVERNNNEAKKYEVYSHEWTDLTDKSGNYGVTILNDSKYGWDKPDDNTLRLSLLYAPKPEGNYVYQGKQDMGWHEFTYSIIGHNGTLDKAKAVEKSTILNSPIRAFVSPKHSGGLGKEFSFVSCDNANVTVRALKKAETGNEYVVRVYENTGKNSQDAKITFAGNITKAVEADGTEKEIGAANSSGKMLNVSIKPFSVKTYKVTFAANKAQAEESQSLTLPFNRRCFSFNDFRSDANFEGGNSYAAELLPDDGITVDNVPFKFGEKDSSNGLSCHGNVINLPEGNKYNKVYILAASSNGDRNATFTVGTNKQTVTVPFYSGFIGQWGHTGHTKGYLKDAEVAYIGTHSHSSMEDKPYVFTYMFKYGIDIPKGAKTITLPNDRNIVVFAATLTEDGQQVVQAGKLFRTSNKENLSNKDSQKKTSLLTGAKVIDVSGEYDSEEVASNLIDGNEDTKWCDGKMAPNYVTFDLGQEKTVSSWRLLNAGAEEPDFITRSCILQGRKSLSEDWQTLDLLDGNKQNIVEREFAPATVRYIRLFVTGPTQEIDHDAVRIYELQVF